MSYPYLSDVVRALTGLDLPLPFATFGILVACAMFAAAACLTAELRRLYELGALLPGRRLVNGKPIVKPPHELVSNLTMLVMFTGIVGARLFHILENTHQFALDPWSMIFSRSGLSVFGGLIVGTLAGLVYVRRWQLPVRPMLDAVAPAMMLGYAIGRLGCQVSGDGDWGTMANMALKPDWLPTWFWAQTYENNIYGEVIAAPGVYPTPIYESVIALACFGLLWALRRHPFRTGWLFSLYLLLAGVERLLIEQIRVNPPYSFAGIHATQAELIAAGLIVAGLVGLALLGRRNTVAAGAQAPQTLEEGI
ncbi:prolipoprotein diacylglyceryl transferase [Massilia agri]|uniref:Phosphatidylglycerol--prolipoprotein diacylglyceryl transferase n=1 Tax=Massilia agri TaxID=1886785 RepID=A0ABT2AF11_9BURK|nr:prolipoprotein diacylglyceryl transferase family protein [Massilia agri]MCS0594770.1 prolipoprotein diacylglyceryl transferase [Massilia agri]